MTVAFFSLILSEEVEHWPVLGVESMTRDAWGVSFARMKEEMNHHLWTLSTFGPLSQCILFQMLDQ